MLCTQQAFSKCETGKENPQLSFKRSPLSDQNRKDLWPRPRWAAKWGCQPATCGRVWRNTARQGEPGPLCGSCNFAKMRNILPVPSQDSTIHRAGQASQGPAAGLGSHPGNGAGTWAGARKCEPTGGSREGPLAGPVTISNERESRNARRPCLPGETTQQGCWRAWVGDMRYMYGFLYHPGSQEFSP